MKDGNVVFGCFGLNGHQILDSGAQVEGMRIHAVAGVDRLEFERSHSGIAQSVAWYPSLEALLNDPEIDAVSLCSGRRDEQAQHTVAALQAGKHVYAEKPLATDASDLDCIRGAWKSSGKELRAMTGAVCMPAVVHIRALIEQGGLGRVIQATAQKSYPFHDRRPQDRGIDGGLITQAGIHAITSIRAVTGLEIEGVSAMDTRAGNPHDGQLQMAAVLCMQLSNGAVASANFNYLNPAGMKVWGDDRLSVYGIEGMAEFRHGGEYVGITIGQDNTQEISVAATDHAAHLRAFVRLLCDGTSMADRAEDCLTDTAVVLAAQRSADKGGIPIAVDVPGGTMSKS